MREDSVDQMTKAAKSTQALLTKLKRIAAIGLGGMLLSCVKAGPTNSAPEAMFKSAPPLATGDASIDSAPPDALAEVPSAPAPPPLPYHKIDVLIGDKGKSQCAQNLIRATEQVLHSDSFRKNFLKYAPMLDKARSGTPLSPKDVFAGYFGTDVLGGGPGPLPVMLVLDRKDACSDALRAKKLTNKNVPAVTDLFRCGDHALVQIHEYVIMRWYSDGKTAPTVSKACAINTIAHELTHTVLKRVEPLGQLYTDDGHDDLKKTTYLVSYSTGAIAQCTYMQDKALIAGNTAALDKCVETWGTTDFLVSNECTDPGKATRMDAPCPMP
jgi:hypothetical protein